MGLFHVHVDVAVAACTTQMPFLWPHDRRRIVTHVQTFTPINNTLKKKHQGAVSCACEDCPTKTAYTKPTLRLQGTVDIPVTTRPQAV